MKFFLVALCLISSIAFAQRPTADESFYKQAAEGGAAGVESGKLAQVRGSASEVKELGALMVAEHTKANAKLHALASRRKVELPSTLSDQHEDMQKKLKTLSGLNFDKAYLDVETSEHAKFAAMLETEIKAGQDTEAKAWAKENLPIVQKHLTVLKQLASVHAELDEGSVPSEVGMSHGLR